MSRKRHGSSIRPKQNSVHQGKVLGKLRIRSGYVIVRSLYQKAENLNTSVVSSLSTSSPNKLSSRKNRKLNGNVITKIATKNPPGAQLNASLTTETFKDTLKKHWKKTQPFSNIVADFISHPFKVVTIHNLFSSMDYVEVLSSELLSTPFHKLDNDLHVFEQTLDLCESPVDTPALKSFLDLLKGPLLSWMQEVTGKKLTGKITLTGSKYSYSEYLLCHDDNLSDRSIAFILYLTKGWSKSDGGALQLFECNNEDQPLTVVHSIFPTFGSFAFFEVGSQSYHQVQEVLSKEKVRLSINGWFHGDELPVKPKVQVEQPEFKPPVSPKGCSFERWVKADWLISKNHADIKQDFSYDLSVSIPDFILGPTYKELEHTLLDNNIIWERCGPAHQKNYERAKLSTLPPTMKDFIKLLKSKYMFYFLCEVTVDINPDSKTTPLCYLEVQRWSPGDYTLAIDDDPCSDITGIDVHLYFNVPNNVDSNLRESGTVYYLGPDKNDKGFLEQNAYITPEKNALFLVAHIAGMKRVTKYITFQENYHFHKIIATYSQG